uniref:Uncharacterized protein n=1 Tax=Brassica oleracea var. oleracea TaxID=109376 RepID=A0A0D3DJK5_BRAOL
HIPNHLLQKATVEAPKQWWKLRQTRLWSSTALASPPHHHRRFIKEQGKEKQWCDIAAFPDQAWCGGEVVVVRWRCEHHAHGKRYDRWGSIIAAAVTAFFETLRKRYDSVFRVLLMPIFLVVSYVEETESMDEIEEDKRALRRSKGSS